jgi:hypothetical protein
MSILSTNSSIATAAGGGGSSFHKRADPFEGVTESGTRISIVEQVNVLMKGGQVQKVLVTGEIGLHYRPTTTDEETDEDDDELVLSLTDRDQLEKVTPNSTYLTPRSGGGGEFRISRRSLDSTIGKTVPILKYQVKQSGGGGGKDSSSSVPLIVKPTWRCEPNLTRIIVVYSDNPAFSTSTSSSSPFGDDGIGSGGGIEYSELSLEIPFAPGQVTSFQSKPGSIGTLSQTNGSLNFDLPNPGATAEETKLLVSAQTANAAKVGNLVCRWKIEGKSIAKVGVQVFGKSGARMSEVRRVVESGKYIVA